MHIWISAIGPLVGVVIGSAATYFAGSAQARRHMRWEAARLAQVKLEELALMLDEVATAYRKLSASAIQSMRSQAPFSLDVEPIPFQRFSILINFYAPELQSDLDALRKLTTEFGHTLVNSL